MAQAQQIRRCEVMVTGINNPQDAKYAAKYKEVRYMGLLQDFLEPDMGRSIRQALPDVVKTVLVTKRPYVEQIVQDFRAYHTDMIELCVELSPRQFKALRRQLPGAPIIMVIPVEKLLKVEDHLRWNSWTVPKDREPLKRQVDGCIQEYLDKSHYPTLAAIELDTFNPLTNEVGGSGVRHDALLSGEMVIKYGHLIDIWMSGGIDGDSLRRILEIVNPRVINISSWLLTPPDSVLNRERLSLVCQEVDSFNRECEMEPARRAPNLESATSLEKSDFTL